MRVLRLHWNKYYNTEFFKHSEFTKKLYDMTLVLDRFHQKGHVRSMCKKQVNPDDRQNAAIFKNINTSVWEQFFFQEI